MHEIKLFGNTVKQRVQSVKKKANCKMTINAKEKPAGQKEHFDKVLIPSDRSDPNSPGILEGQDRFQGRRDVSAMLPADKRGRRCTDVDRKGRMDGADSVTAEL